jgi:hypothetical protein
MAQNKEISMNHIYSDIEVKLNNICNKWKRFHNTGHKSESFKNTCRFWRTDIMENDFDYNASQIGSSYTIYYIQRYATLYKLKITLRKAKYHIDMYACSILECAIFNDIVAEDCMQKIGKTRTTKCKHRIVPTVSKVIHHVDVEDIYNCINVDFYNIKQDIEDKKKEITQIKNEFNFEYDIDSNRFYYEATKNFKLKFGYNLNGEDVEHISLVGNFKKLDLKHILEAFKTCPSVIKEKLNVE